jgi:hypothetical protein
MEQQLTSVVERPPAALCHWHADLKKHLPDFLIISPPKTGSTWLAANLQCHPDVFVSRMKEVKYFSMYHRWLDLSWYAGHFREAGLRLKGEASPSYALLPCRMIRWIHSLMPHVKLVFLMRDPVARAWSHARHNLRYREANFENHAGDGSEVREEQWLVNVRHPWPLASGDYLGQLQRWLSVFPRHQVYVDLYERIATEPERLLTRLCDFLEVETREIDWSAFRLGETILPGMEMPLPPALGRELPGLLRERTKELAIFLREQFDLEVGEVWRNTLAPDASECTASGQELARQVFARSFDEEFLADLLDTEVASSDPQLLQEDYFGYNLVLHRGRFLALDQALGDVDVDSLHAAIARDADGPGILLGESLAHLKERVTAHAIHNLQQQVAKLEAHQRGLEDWLSQCDAFIGRLRNSLPFRVQRKVARGLAALLPQKPP